ncbi:MAG TPA: thioredoxin family protein [Thermoanaerobaculia bacterium]|nr:thioredoxin family protein [Thermoanaerobaculia bacterium]
MTHNRSSLRRPAAVLCLLLAVSALASVVAAQGSDTVLRGFQRTGDFVLFVNDKHVPAAEVYVNDKIPAYLILTSALPTPVMLTPRARTVESVHIMKVAKQKDGSVDLLADATLDLLGSFQIEGSDVNFTVQGRKASLKVRPPLLGLKRNADLKTYNPEFARSAQAYAPNPQMIAALKKSAKPAKVRVYFGSWCPHCKRHVPFILRVEDELKGSKIQFEYVGLDRGLPEPDVKRLNLNGVPTGIVYVDGKEVGRILDNDWNSPETSLNRILNGGGTRSGR